MEIANDGKLAPKTPKFSCKCGQEFTTALALMTHIDVDTDPYFVGEDNRGRHE